jgi:hypothetical protein
MIGALDEAAMSIANADDTTAEREQVRAVVHDLIGGLMAEATAKTQPRRRQRSAPRAT